MYVGGLLASLSEYGRAGRVSTFHARVGVHLCGNVALYGVHMHAQWRSLKKNLGGAHRKHNFNKKLDGAHRKHNFLITSQRRTSLVNLW